MEKFEKKAYKILEVMPYKESLDLEIVRLSDIPFPMDSKELIGETLKDLPPVIIPEWQAPYLQQPIGYDPGGYTMFVGKGVFKKGDYGVYDPLGGL